MADFITTYGGRHFYPAEPEAGLIEITDVAHALSLICRGNGHVRTFFSVGQHCLYCAREAVARGYSPRIALAALLHDASEAYMSDVPRPFKKSLPAYVEHEEKLLSMVYERFLGSDLSKEEAAKVKELDDDCLWFDLTYLLNERPDSPEPEMHIEISYEVRDFKSVENEYLEFYKALNDRL